MFYTVTVTLHGNTRTWKHLSEAAAKRVMQECGFKPEAHCIIIRE